MRAVAVFVALALGPAAHARDISFADARARAQRVAPDVGVAERRAGVAEAEVEAVGAWANPTLSVATARESARLSTSVSVPLPLFGQRSTAVDAARADSDAARLDVTVTRREARWSATQAWLDLWEAQARAALLDRAREDADRLARTAQEKLDAGAGPRLDTVRTGADRARAAAEAEAAHRAAAAAGARLAPWIGEDPDSDVSASGEPGYADVLPARSAVAAGLATHPALRRDRAQIDAAEAHVRAEQRQRWPIVDVQLTVAAFDPTQPETDYIFGVSFEVPLFSLRGGAIARARADRALVQATASAEERRLGADVQDAYRRSEGAAAKLRALRVEVLPAVEEAARMAEEGYRTGRLDLLRVLEAQRALSDTRLEATAALAAWARACADLERTSGMDLGVDRAP